MAADVVQAGQLAIHTEDGQGPPEQLAAVGPDAQVLGPQERVPEGRERVLVGLGRAPADQRLAPSAQKNRSRASVPRW